MIKKAGIILAKSLVVVFACVGLYASFYSCQRDSVLKKVEKLEANRPYDKDLKYHKPYGEPIFLVRPGNATTLFFIDGFRGQVAAGHYLDWFKALHENYHINVVCPVTGLQGWPVAYRTRAWHREEDMRQALQVYDAYCANLPAGHRVVTGSMSFGGFSNITLAVFGKRKPDAMVMVAPVNTVLDYKSGSALMRWLATQTSWLRYIVPLAMRGGNKERATLYDIVNSGKNLETWNALAKDTVNWEENLAQGLHLTETAEYMEKDLVPRVTNEKILILYGDSDLTFSAAGFESLAEKLRASGNRVKTVKFAESGHMLLYDNGGDAAKKLVLDVLQNRYAF
ncbi:MAG: hypothetical protein EPN93_04225 [Spirochaetes bacterium]|nr:MAG: hypothetical protein EPN93_04225 [Spirochaetota bacterium]